MHTDARRIGQPGWEKFKLQYTGDPRGYYALQAINGDYVTAVNSGGLTTALTHDVLHTNATRVDTWEKFNLVYQPDGTYAIQAFDGHFLTARLAGGQVVDTFNSNATESDHGRSSGSCVERRSTKCCESIVS